MSKKELFIIFSIASVIAIILFKIFIWPGTANIIKEINELMPIVKENLVIDFIDIVSSVLLVASVLVFIYAGIVKDKSMDIFYIPFHLILLVILLPIQILSLYFFPEWEESIIVSFIISAFFLKGFLKSAEKKRWLYLAMLVFNMILFISFGAEWLEIVKL